MCLACLQVALECLSVLKEATSWLSRTHAEGQLSYGRTNTKPTQAQFRGPGHRSHAARACIASIVPSVLDCFSKECLRGPAREVLIECAAGQVRPSRVNEKLNETKNDLAGGPRKTNLDTRQSIFKTQTGEGILIACKTTSLKEKLAFAQFRTEIPTHWFVFHFDTEKERRSFSLFVEQAPLTLLLFLFLSSGRSRTYLLQVRLGVHPSLR